MDFFTGSNAKAAVFEVGTARYSLPAEVMAKAEVQGSGLIHVLRKEGFKDIPPMVPRSEDGALQINRPQEGFELMVEHLLGLEPLRGCPVADFASKYILLKTELIYWQLPTVDVAFDDNLFYQSAWTDGDCFYPMTSADTAAFKREDTAEQHMNNFVSFSVSSSVPSLFNDYINNNKEGWTCWVSDELPLPLQQKTAAAAAAAATDNAEADNKIYLVVGTDRFLCKMPSMTNPCVHFTSLPERDNFTPCALIAAPAAVAGSGAAAAAAAAAAAEVTIIWSRGAFIHIQTIKRRQKGDRRFQIDVLIREPAWLCIHPILGSVLSGVEGPVPHIFCFGMPEAEVVRFFPWGAIVINGSVKCEPLEKHKEGVEADSNSSSTAHTRPLLEALGVSSLNLNHTNPKPSLVATILRFFNKAYQPPVRVFFANVDHQAEEVTLHRLKDFDVHDIRNEEASGFNVVAALRGALAEIRGDTAIPDKIQGGKMLLFPINNKGAFSKESQVAIDNGGPQGEELSSIALYGEYNCKTRKYYTFEMGKKLYEFHKQMFLTRTVGPAGGCNIM